MLISKPVHALQFDYHRIFNDDVGKILADRLTFVLDWKGCLNRKPDAPKPEFNDQSRS